jgi:hypothetical protein
MRDSRKGAALDFFQVVRLVRIERVMILTGIVSMKQKCVVLSDMESSTPRIASLIYVTK